MPITRRDVFRALFSISFTGGAAALTSCKPSTSGSSSGSSGSGSPSWPRTTTHEGIEMLELFPNGATEASPLIIFVHGMGGRPQNAAELWSDKFPYRAHIALPRAFDKYGDGYSWFEFKDGMTDEQFGAAVGAAEDRLWKGIANLAAGKRIIVSGFSQGGILAYAMASRHADAIIKAFPISGSCPGPLLPKNKSHSAPLFALHGTADDVLDIKWAREAVNAFKQEGNDAELKEYAGVGHTITPAMRTDVFAAIGRVLPTPT